MKLQDLLPIIDQAKFADRVEGFDMSLVARVGRDLWLNAQRNSDCDKIKKHIEGAREKIARRYMVQCEKGEPFECPHLEDCKHPDCDICQWQLDEADQIIKLLIGK